MSNYDEKKIMKFLRELTNRIYPKHKYQILTGETILIILGEIHRKTSKTTDGESFPRNYNFDNFKE